MLEYKNSILWYHITIFYLFFKRNLKTMIKQDKHANTTTMVKYHHPHPHHTPCFLPQVIPATAWVHDVRGCGAAGWLTGAVSRQWYVRR